MVDNPDELSLQALVRVLASGSLDSRPSAFRANFVEHATLLISESPEARSDLASGANNLNAIPRKSIHAFKRITSLYCAAIESCTDDEDETMAGLCRGLCEVLAHADNTSPALAERCRQRLEHSSNSGNRQTVAASFLKVAKEASSPTYASALALGSVLNTEEDQTRAAWLDLFLEKSLQTTFAPASEISTMQLFLQNVTQDEWDNSLASIMGLKLKANPERAFETIKAILDGLKNAQALHSISDQLDGDTQFLTTLIKQLKSPKENLRDMARDTIVRLALLGSSKQDDAVPKIMTALSKAITSTAALSQPDHRQGAYAALSEIAMYTTSDTELSTDALSTLLSALSTAVSKENKKAAAAKKVGLEAMLQWMVVAKRQGGSNKGYDEALTLLRTPAIKNNAADCVLSLGALVVTVNEDMLESIVLDLWKDAAFGKGLISVIEASAKKYSATTSVPLVEGLIAAYLCLVRAFASGKLTLQAPVQKALSAGSAKLSKTSFIYGKSMMDAVTSNSTAGQILPRTIALYTKLLAKEADGEKPPPLLAMIGENETTSASKALAACITHPATSCDLPSTAILSTVQTVLTYETTAGDALLEALMAQVNEHSLATEELASSLNETREAREAFTPIDESFAKLSVKGQLSPTAPHMGMDPNAVRRVAHRLASHTTTNKGLAQALLLTHVGTTLKGLGRQRNGLVARAVQLLDDVVLPMAENDKESSLMSTLAQMVSNSACLYYGNDNSESSEPKGDSDVISVAVHQAALSFVTSMGGIASNFDPAYDDPEDEEMKKYVFARTFCTTELSSRFDKNLRSALSKVEALTESELDLYRSKPGVPYRPNGKEDGEDAQASGKVQNAEKKRSGGKSRRKGNFGSSFEDEEWERQMKKELQAKKKQEKAKSINVALSPEDKKLVEEQAKERQRMEGILNGSFSRTLSAVQCLCLSDIEVGNTCIPALYQSVIVTAVSKCKAISGSAALKSKSVNTLATLASCVYEIDEVHAPTLARAITTSCQATTTDNFQVSALPSPCAPAAVAIFEMDDFGDSLSGPSFVLMFPILRAALTGPRTSPGCEAALRVLYRHMDMLSGEDVDESVTPLRKDIAITVLEILSHDRSQTFVDPTPIEALVACYRTDESLSTAELAPLLDERGALGNKNCRTGAMIALAAIAEDHPKLIKKNPLVENRIWINCFEKNESISSEARKAWRIANGMDGEDDASSLPPPSIMYSIPLLPLFSHSDKTIADSSANAYAHAMGMHPASIERNLIKTCQTYIQNYPSAFGDEKPTTGLPPQASAKALTKPVAPKKTAKIVTGLPKKKPMKKSALAVAGIGKPKTGIKKKKVITNSALLKPKKERTLDTDDLAKQFVSKAKISDAEKDTPEKLAIRLGVIRSIAALTESSTNVKFELPTLKILSGFLTAFGLADGDAGAQGAARNALRDVIASNGSSDEAIAFLLPHLEAVLSTGVADEKCLGDLPIEKIPRDVDASDRRKEGSVVALGSVALHLKGPENAEKIDNTINMLIEALKTPSESVQSSVAACLAKLMKKGNTQDRIEQILSDLIGDCLHGETLATRRGAAYGISAAVKGSGIATLKKFEIVKKLEEGCESGSSSSKEGSLFAIELLSDRLGLLFEPYVIVLLPALLKTFSDSSDHVRTAASHAAGLIMSKLSAHGVKLVMPAVLKSFEDPSWRTKQASIVMLGSMSHCAPKQLAAALPKVVPKLTEAFSDTHPKVKSSAEEALNEISTVIKNPEVSEIAPSLLKALTDPADGTTRALEALIETEFLHAIDSPSLALIVPVLHRGLRDRGAKTKRYGALISGNICSMIDDARDFVPYLPILLPDLKTVLLDPIPDVRSTSAKALGALTRGLGEDTLPDLRSWLIETLRSEGISSAERSGAGQGLTEVLVAGGASVVEEVMHEEILPLRTHPQPSTREGVLWVLTFLPTSLGQSFTPLIDSSLPALLGGLSDDNEQVREVALRAGRVLVRSHGKAHVDKILPSLEDGLSDEDYRIRVASLTLLGDLLSMIGGTTVIKGDGDTQDDIRKAERAQAQIALALGNDTRKRVLSGLYLARCDTAAVVRQSAIQVWKTVVSVTVRALRDILQVLVGKVVDALASGHPERTQVAGRCLGDITAKLGESVLPSIIPVLRNALYTGDEHTRRGVCVGLSEVISGSTKENIMRFIEIIVKVVQDALCDDNEGVREMASSCFQSLHAVVGNRALDEIVPSLLVAIEDDTDEERRHRALNGITGILSIRSRELLPYIIPRLISSPITKSHAEALSGIATVTGATIHMHFNTIIPTLITELAEFYDADVDEEEDSRQEAIRGCARSMCCSVDEIGVNWLVGEIASKCGSDKESIRKEGCWMMQITVEERKDEKDFYEQIPIILRELLYRFNDENTQVLKAANAAFKSLSKHVPAEVLVDHVEFIRNLIASIVSECRRRKGGVGDGEFLLPGFNIPKGLEPLLPIYQRGILYGNATIREASAAGLGELIDLTASKYLAGPLIVKMTGPLLRIVGDRNPSAVKIAILRTLGLVLVKGGPALRAFVPQFQTTFVKALSDPSRQVRLEAIGALALLMPLSTRVDPLIKELVAASLGKSAGSSAETAGVAVVQAATLEALATVLKNGGKKAKLPDSIPSALDASKEVLRHEDEGVREAAAKVMGAACEILGDDIANETLDNEILTNSDDSSDVRHGKACACRRIMASSVACDIDESAVARTTKLITKYMKDDKSAVKEAACVAIGAVVGSNPDSISKLREVEPLLLEILKDNQERMEVHRAVGRGLCLALQLNGADGVSLMGKDLIDVCLQMAMSGAQRVQFSFNDVLWLAFDVANGEAGLESYQDIANFDNSKAAKSLYTKVLTRIKSVNDED